MAASQSVTDQNAAAAQHELLGLKDGEAQTFTPTDHPGAQWFDQAGLGLFIHWGISSVHGLLDISWSMMKNCPWVVRSDRIQVIPPVDYYELRHGFTASHYDPVKWLTAAKEAGVRYAVLTTKHHDGFTLWPSRHAEIGVQEVLPGRDLVREFVDACREVGLRVGLYFSPRDWYIEREYRSWEYLSEKQRMTPEKLSGDATAKLATPYDMHHQPTTWRLRPAGFNEWYTRQIGGQIEELLTGYGHIDLIWFDGKHLPRSEFVPPVTVEQIRAWQPHILINPRLFGGGDFQTPECRRPDTRPEGRWEECTILSGGPWGYNVLPYRSVGGLLDTLTFCRGWGGNVLFNCAPNARGEMPEDFYARMAELREWMGHSSEAVFDVQPGPYPERCSVPVTMRSNTWYVHPRLHNDQPVFDPIVLRDVDPPRKAKLLRTGEPVTCSYDQSQRTATIEIADRRRTPRTDTVRVEW